MDITSRANHSLARPSFGLVNSGYRGYNGYDVGTVPLFRFKLSHLCSGGKIRILMSLGFFGMMHMHLIQTQKRPPVIRISVIHLITFMAFLKVCTMVPPTTIASQYDVHAWWGAVVLCFLWFLHRWKTNLISYVLISKSLVRIYWEKILTVDKISSVGLFVVGSMTLAKACGVPVQSILTVGGIGVLAIAFVASDILGNVLSGLFIHFSMSFSPGDTIFAGSIEGRVVEMGLTTITLLSAEGSPVIIPYSLFSRKVIVKKPRAPCQAMGAKILLKLDALDKTSDISSEIMSTLISHPKIFLAEEAPYCRLTRNEGSSAELTLGYNLKQMSEDELYTAEREILLRAVKIIKKHGATVRELAPAIECCTNLKDSEKRGWPVWF